MKSVRQGDFALVGKILRCKVMIALDDEITGRTDYTWADTYVPLDIISYFSMNIDDKGDVNKSQVIITLSGGQDLICKGFVHDIVILYNSYLENENKFKFN